MAHEFVFYHYTPSIVAAIIYGSLFALAGISHVFLTCRFRAWFFIPVIVGCVFESTGYFARIASHHDRFAMTPFIVQSVTILVAPALFAATIYMTLGRIIRLLEAEHLSIIRVNWLTKAFVGGDILTFLIQSGGAGIMVKDASSMKLGNKIILSGLGLQILIFGLFVLTASIFHIRIKRSPTSASSDPAIRNWHKHQLVLYITSALVLVRNIVRVVEYIQGNSGYILSHEVFLYLFDGTLMLLVVVIFMVLHPSKLLRRGTIGPNSSRPLEDGGYLMKDRTRR